MAQVIRMTESDLVKMINETVMNILAEEGVSAWQIMKNVGKASGKYFIDRVFKGAPEHKMGDSSEDVKMREYNKNIRARMERGESSDQIFDKDNNLRRNDSNN